MIWRKNILSTTLKRISAKIYENLNS